MPDTVRVAQSLLERLFAGDFATAREAFDPNLRVAVSDVTLAETWNKISSLFGKPIRHSDTRTSKTISSNAHIIYLTWDFEKERLCARVVVDNANQIIGLSFEAPVIH